MSQNAEFCELGRSSSEEVYLSDSLADDAAYSYQPYYSGESQQFYPVVHYLYYPVNATTPYDNSVTYYPVPIYQSMFPTTVFYYGFVYYYPIQSLNPCSSPVESEYYSPSSSSVEPSSSDEYEDCFSDASESIYHTPCNSPELPSPCEENGEYFYDEQQQSFCADITVDNIESCDTFETNTNDIEYLTTESLGSVKIEEEPSTDDEDDVAFSTEEAYDASSEYSDSDVEVDGLYQSYSLVDENISPPRQFLSDFYTDKDDRYKKCKSRLWYFNAVSKSNCCDCYKEGKKLSESGLIKKDIESCDEYKRIKETEEHTDFIKECIYTSVLKGNVRKNEKYRVDYLPLIDEMQEECPGDAAEINDETNVDETNDETNVDGENDPLNESSTELESPKIEPEHSKKKFKGLKKFLSRLFCCSKKPP